MQKAFTLIELLIPRQDRDKSSQGFTLIELLVVIAVIAILSIVVVLSLNPAEMLRQSRDQNRLSDMDTLTHAVSLYQEDQAAAAGSVPLGTTNTVYVSLPDPNASTTAGSNCASLGLPLLPTGYAYHCAGPNYYRTTSGNGWIPVNFSSVSTGSPLGQLPVDPTNASSSRLYYTYTTNGTQYEVTSVMEAAKNKPGGSNDQISNDGGALASVYEKGSKLGLEPLDYGDSSLMGLWTFEEGTGTVAYDWSGNGNNGSWNAAGSGFLTGKVGTYAGQFWGSNYVSVPDNSSLRPSLFTVSAWVNFGSTAFRGIVSKEANSSPYSYGLRQRGNSTIWFSESGGGNDVQSNTLYVQNAWYMITASYDGAVVRLYINGLLDHSGNMSFTDGSTNPLIIGGAPVDADFLGLLDNVRLYNRVLSAAEIAALYTGNK